MNRPTLPYYRDLVRVLVAKELKVRYKSTVLGYAWSVLHPLAFASVFFVLFRIIMRIQMENYALFLITGLFPWQWFQNSVTMSNRSFLGSASLIKKVKFPRAFLPLAGVLNDLLHFLISLPIIVLFMAIYRTWPSPAWIWGVPTLIALQFTLTYGLALFFATCNLFFRDLERITFILTLLWFYVTPVVFPVSMVPEHLQWAVYANPMAGVIVCWRRLLLEGTLPPALLASAGAYAVAAALVGYHVYRRLEWRFAEVV
jgi:lipopolysaccharide transport system permease protein